MVVTALRAVAPALLAGLLALGLRAGVAAAADHGAELRGRGEPWQRRALRERQGGDYLLDGLTRRLPPSGQARCPDLVLLSYPGAIVRYHKPVRVNVAFRERLRRFEAVVRDVALATYGRAPARIRHLGTYNCRRMAGRRTKLSEHALGNGIDVLGFDFAPTRRPLPRGVPRVLGRAFQVRVGSHWSARSGVAARHSQFLRELVRRLARRPDIFRVMLGPGYPGHRNHFHFDCAPYRLVAIGE